jgi:ketosteroid isomerase-like protein
MKVDVAAASGIVTAIVLTVSCASRSAPPATDLSAASAATLREAANAWARAAIERDAATMSRYFADDAFVMYPQPQPTVGRSANHAAWLAVFAQPGARHPLTSDSVIVSASGDLGYTVGRWRLNTPPTGNRAAVDVGGRYIAVWRPVGPGRAWQIVTLSANTHRPTPEL